MFNYPPLSPAFIPGGRLSLTTGLPLTTSDVISASTIYYVPYIHNFIQLYTGSYWAPIELPATEKTYTLTGLASGSVYDIFGYLSNNSLAMEALVWTNTTTRATEITLQDGRYCKSGDKTRLWLGSFRTTNTTTTDDSDTKRLLFNAYNRKKRKLKKTESTDSWTYTTAAYRSVNANDANRVEVLAGVTSLLELSARASANNGTGGVYAAVGIDEDGVNGNDADIIATNPTMSSLIINSACHMKRNIFGYHYYQWTEYSAATGTTTWFGDNGVPTIIQNGMLGEIEA